MADTLGDRLPDELVHALDDEALTDEDQTGFLLVTTDENGAPRICVVSAGELLICDERTLRVALWHGSRTAHNLGRSGTALLAAISPGSVIYVRAEPAPLAVPETANLECFELTVKSVEADVHAGMPVTSGITFRADQPDHATAVADWRRQRALLASAEVSTT
ncbi:hypothetical protein [Actinoallomurus iriomotensis]|uniref:Pyridoxamine 5'-phosphate oxidase putative domain-containing protein n=1 Tax=Actinoallomurus iriomotensis TaxID=478107 RepID=A0A9W6VNJ7_9ACTN|nr:hypothetical protein [Actinoallomurus iriomotensis]GLY73839.1 hypothetical protein Airi01_021060 [Actinoallomurus iriomotensis]